MRIGMSVTVFIAGGAKFSFIPRWNSGGRDGAKFGANKAWNPSEFKG